MNILNYRLISHLLLIGLVFTTPFLTPLLSAENLSKIKEFKVKKDYDRRNLITDEQAWIKKHLKGTQSLDPTESVRLFPFLPATTAEHFSLAHTVSEGVGKPIIAFYGQRPPGYRWTPATLLMIYSYDGEQLLTVHPKNLLDSMTNADEHASPSIHHALIKDRLLYLSVSHRTYAKSTKGTNAIIQAYDFDGAVLWTSRSLVANSDNFLAIGDVIFTGYGFTKEPDYIYQLNRYTGAILTRHPLKAAPSHFAFEAPDRIHVRTYNRDVGYQIVVSDHHNVSPATHEK